MLLSEKGFGAQALKGDSMATELADVHGLSCTIKWATFSRSNCGSRITAHCRNYESKDNKTSASHKSRVHFNYDWELGLIKGGWAEADRLSLCATTLIIRCVQQLI